MSLTRDSKMNPQGSSLLEIRGLLDEVKEQFLSKDKLENYHSQLSNIYSDIQFEIADIKKLRAVFFFERINKETSDISIKRSWEVTPEGLRLIELEASVKSISKILSSLKSRLYATY